jgi:hypothetical protein
MKILRTFYFGILASFCSATAMGGPVDPSGQELVTAPIQTLNSPSQLSAIEENARLAAHGNDHHQRSIACIYHRAVERKLYLNASTVGSVSPRFSSPSEPETDDRLNGSFLDRAFYSTRSHQQP